MKDRKANYTDSIITICCRSTLTFLNREWICGLHTWSVILTNTLCTFPVCTRVFKFKYMEDEWQLQPWLFNENFIFGRLIGDGEVLILWPGRLSCLCCGQVSILHFMGKKNDSRPKWYCVVLYNTALTSLCRLLIPRKRSEISSSHNGAKQAFLLQTNKGQNAPLMTSHKNVHVPIMLQKIRNKVMCNKHSEYLKITKWFC